MQVITTEDLKIKRIKVPLITGIYDPLSKRSDGTITSQAPIIVNGRNLKILDLSCIELCLVPCLDNKQIINVSTVYKYSSKQVIASLPVLPPGEYFPAIKIKRKHEETYIYILPVSWVVLPECSGGRYKSSCCEAKNKM